jgi:phosphoglycerate kinase
VTAAVAPRTIAPPVRGLERVPLLHARPVVAGERWIYSAGFNVGPGLRHTDRIDEELDDLRHIAGAGGRVAILSHHGDRDQELDFVAAYLSRRLARPVRYVGACASADAVRAAAALADGEICLFANTRRHAGEELGDPELALAFARLGDLVAVGGFSKAHRAHASNAGLIGLRPAFAARSLVRAAERLAPWAGVDEDRRSVAVIGGAKPEKVLSGLAGLARTYDAIIPGGVVLNTLLRARGVDVGGSLLGTRPDECVAAAREILDSSPRAALHLPSRVLVARRRPAASRLAAAAPAGRDVPVTHAIVDTVIEGPAEHCLRRLVAGGGRALIAGPPGLAGSGFPTATERVARALGGPRVECLMLGGDTAAEVPPCGIRSSGGGAALQYLTEGTTTVFDALRAHADRREGG